MPLILINLRLPSQYIRFTRLHRLRSLDELPGDKYDWAYANHEITEKEVRDIPPAWQEYCVSVDKTHHCRSSESIICTPNSGDALVG